MGLANKLTKSIAQRGLLSEQQNSKQKLDQVTDEILSLSHWLDIRDDRLVSLCMKYGHTVWLLQAKCRGKPETSIKY